MSGNHTLTFSKLRASFTVDKELIGKQDPYVIFTSGNSKAQTKAIRGVGTGTAEWKETYSLDKFSPSSSSVVEVSVYNHNTLLPDNVIGTGTVDLANQGESSLSGSGEPVSVILTDKKAQEVGTISFVVNGGGYSGRGRTGTGLTGTGGRSGTGTTGQYGSGTGTTGQYGSGSGTTGQYGSGTSGQYGSGSGTSGNVVGQGIGTDKTVAQKASDAAAATGKTVAIEEGSSIGVGHPQTRGSGSNTGANTGSYGTTGTSSYNSGTNNGSYGTGTGIAGGNTGSYGTGTNTGTYGTGTNSGSYGTGTGTAGGNTGPYGTGITGGNTGSYSTGTTGGNTGSYGTGTTTGITGSGTRSSATGGLRRAGSSSSSSSSSDEGGVRREGRVHRSRRNKTGVTTGTGVATGIVASGAQAGDRTIYGEREGDIIDRKYYVGTEARPQDQALVEQYREHNPYAKDYETTVQHTGRERLINSQIEALGTRERLIGQDHHVHAHPAEQIARHLPAGALSDRPGGEGWIQTKPGPICDSNTFSITGDRTITKERVTDLREHREFEKEFEVKTRLVGERALARGTEAEILNRERVLVDEKNKIACEGHPTADASGGATIASQGGAGSYNTTGYTAAGSTGTGYNTGSSTTGYNTGTTGTGTGYNSGTTGTGTGYNSGTTGTGTGYNSGTGSRGTTGQTTGEKIASYIPGTEENRASKGATNTSTTGQPTLGEKAAGFIPGSQENREKKTGNQPQYA